MLELESCYAPGFTFFETNRQPYAERGKYSLPQLLLFAFNMWRLYPDAQHPVTSNKISKLDDLEEKEKISKQKEFTSCNTSRDCIWCFNIYTRGSSLFGDLRRIDTQQLYSFQHSLKLFSQPQNLPCIVLSNHVEYRGLRFMHIARSDYIRLQGDPRGMHTDGA